MAGPQCQPRPKSLGPPQAFQNAPMALGCASEPVVLNSQESVRAFYSLCGHPFLQVFLLSSDQPAVCPVSVGCVGR